MASATLSGSPASRGLGVREVFTAQNRHPLVHSSPISMMVAVAISVPDFPPLQHSEIFGHLASSHTVCRERERSWPLISWKRAEEGISVFNQFGNRFFSIFRFVLSFFSLLTAAIPQPDADLEEGKKSCRERSSFNLELKSLLNRQQIFIGDRGQN